MVLNLFSQATVAQLEHSESNTVQLATLKRIKNDLIGHDQKKDLCIRLGFVTPIVKILASNSTAELIPAKLEATIILGSLAHGKLRRLSQF
jgi:hypothetical protein